MYCVKWDDSSSATYSSIVLSKVVPEQEVFCVYRNIYLQTNIFLNLIVHQTNQEWITRTNFEKLSRICYKLYLADKFDLVDCTFFSHAKLQTSGFYWIYLFKVYFLYHIPNLEHSIRYLQVDIHWNDNKLNKIEKNQIKWNKIQRDENILNILESVSIKLIKMY